MLPKAAMPSAPPNSAAVSEIPAAAPARSGGTEPMIRSLVSVNIGDVPSEKTVDPITTSVNPEPGPTWVNTPKPMAASTRPAAITTDGRTWRTIDGVRLEPTTNERAQGSVQRPASSGDRP